MKKNKMIEEIKEYRNLKKIEHTLVCPNCNIFLQTENVVLTTYPAQYKYYCINCNYSIISTKLYPYIEIIADPYCTYYQEIDDE